MGKTHQLDKIIEAGRLRLLDHLSCHLGSELRKTQRRSAGRRRSIRDPERFCRREKRHDLRIRDRDLLDIDTGKVRKHTDHGRIIVTQDIEF